MKVVFDEEEIRELSDRLYDLKRFCNIMAFRIELLDKHLGFIIRQKQLKESGDKELRIP